jgi:hypothetical protein
MPAGDTSVVAKVREWGVVQGSVNASIERGRTRREGAHTRKREERKTMNSLGLVAADYCHEVAFLDERGWLKYCTVHACPY